MVDPRAGGALKLVGRSNRKHQTRIKKSGKSAAAANSGRTRYLIPHRLGGHKIDITRVTGGLVGDGAKAPNARPGTSGSAKGNLGKGGSGNGGVSNGVGNGGISNGVGSGNNSGPGVGGSGVLKPINAGPSPAALVAKARRRKKIK